MLRFRFSLIEPDVRIFRIRLSDQVSPQGFRERPKQTFREIDETERSMDILDGESAFSS
jgi:hypothetical protein